MRLSYVSPCTPKRYESYQTNLLYINITAMTKDLNSKVSANVPCDALRVLYGILEKEEIPYNAYVRKADKGVRLVTICADVKDIPHFTEVLNKHQL